MARRIHGDIDVRRRPDGGAVITLKSATGEAFEIERDADQTAALHEKLAATPSITPSPEPKPAKTIKPTVEQTVEPIAEPAKEPADDLTSEGDTSNA